MQTKINDFENIKECLCCSICNDLIEQNSEDYQCQNSNCESVFPIKNGVPILINEETSTATRNS
jgi:uncharacterized protein YbaR (Trm112 family)